jgi:hypothetical protein
VLLFPRAAGEKKSKHGRAGRKRFFIPERRGDSRLSLSLSSSSKHVV